MIFTASDFAGCMNDYHAAQCANRKLNEYLESCPVVYCGPSYRNKWIECETMHTTKKARLFGIEEIKKEKCDEHWPIGSADPTKVICQKCGVQLVQEWREVKK
jgi:hypothetical protein